MKKIFFSGLKVWGSYVNQVLILSLNPDKDFKCCQLLEQLFIHNINFNILKTKSFILIT